MGYNIGDHNCKNNHSNRSNRTELSGAKIAHEFMVDVLGGLIPGALFLFCLILCIGLPMLCYLGPTYDFKNILKDADWFWIVAFLSFLILSYVIGHIFYRADIKEPDRRDIRREQKKKFMSLMNDLNSIDRGVKGKKNRYLYKCRHVSALLGNEIKALTDGLRILDGGNGSNGNPYNQEYEKSCRDAMDFLSGVTERKLQVRDFERNMLIILFPELATSGMKINPGKEIDYEKRSTVKVLFPHIEGVSYNAVSIIEHASKVVKLVGCSHLCKFWRVNWIHLRWFFFNHSKGLEKISQRITKKFKYKSDEVNLYTLIVCYLILHMQNESGCATEERCDFPYMSYYKYLLKRQQNHLLPYVKWTTGAQRTKNQLNIYKIQLQLAMPFEYSIIAKNESHIRMASSSWHVARVIRTLAVIMLIITISLAAATIWIEIANDLLCHHIIRWMPVLSGPQDGNLLLAIIFPIITLSFTSYLNRAVPRFIHYQRLREIFHTLEIYSIWDSGRKQQYGQQ